MDMDQHATGSKRLRIRVSGAVQGVGMRPFVHGLAHGLGLSGFVLNGADGVTIEVEGEATDAFLDRLASEAPPLARIGQIVVETIRTTGETGFSIRESIGGSVTTRIVPDAATCPKCLEDIRNPASRFHGYAFTNCTHCGPRYTITRALPYDRAQTAMAGFTMCPACRADYEDPASRRFHAEPVACPSCGPQLSHSVDEIAAALAAGRIIALKGIGGFHLMCDATREDVVAELRRRKAREAKPFAVMVAGPKEIAGIAEASPDELALATSTPRPIVLMALATGHPLAPSVSPRLAHVGVVLAYAPLHHLLFDALAAIDGPKYLVATSANPGGEPLVIDDEDARRRLGGIADMIVTHDRAIVIRADDSVMQVIAGAPAFLRRARGFVPDPVPLAEDGPPVLALGAHLKATVTVTRGREAFISQHVGDLDTVETVRFLEETIAHLTAILDVRPEIVASDLAADYRSTRIAEGLGLPHARIQHHLAHVAAVAAEHGLTGPVLGIALDGHGQGSDGGNWGGELILLEAGGWRRLGALHPLALPGGDRAAREPARMAAAALSALGRAQEIAHRFADHPFARPLAAHLSRPGLFPVTSSMGRLFDAAAGLLGTCLKQDYEGQAAMELEALVRQPVALPHGYILSGGTLDFRPLLSHLADEEDARRGAEIFHGTVIAGVAAWGVAAARYLGVSEIALSGGCFHNRVLTEGLVAAFGERGLRALVHRAVPPGDGGLSLGQALLARRGTDLWSREG